MSDSNRPVLIHEVQRSPFTHHRTTTLRVYCGCNERFDNIPEGEAHASMTGHTLHITGEIRVPRR